MFELGRMLELVWPTADGHFWNSQLRGFEHAPLWWE